ncbi:tetratricopeptide repeat protein [Echinimonas agarilytica]|uniref:Tetratricopeptide repeat protein n=1 Tax=Echinimonas agarilytica TaxID=1215918 RepID=A0AA41W494_9GAMM|nr:tetratricopeptide repeat protein [Echinimonas agarilytica]MCM2678582.1 tetratricopeptide repeat protein [Echinimonas agarilytica]
MSVINEMLKDLESRKSSTEQAQQPDFRKSTSQVWLSRLLPTVTLLVAAVLVYWIWFAPDVETNRETILTVQPTIALEQASQAQSDQEESIVKPNVDESTNGIGATAPTSASGRPPAATDEVKADIPAPSRGYFDVIANAGKTLPVKEQTEAVEVTPPVERIPEVAPIVKETASPKQVEKVVSKPSVVQKRMTAKELIEIQLNEAREYSANGRFADAEARYKAVLRRQPTNSDARVELVALYNQTERHSMALQEIDGGLRVTPSQPELNMIKAQLLLGQGDVNAAWLALQAVNESQVQDDGFFMLKAGVASQMGDHQSAYASYVGLTNREPGTSRWWLGRAISAENIQNIEDAVSSYKIALEKGGLSPASTQYVMHRLNTLGLR